jgi:hypothetical protein
LALPAVMLVFHSVSKAFSKSVSPEDHLNYTAFDAILSIWRIIW